jgi:hypothetical protein
VHDIVGLHKVCICWIPKEWTEEHKHNSVGGINYICWNGMAMKATISLIASKLAMRVGYTILNHKANTSHLKPCSDKVFNISF